MTEPIPYWHTRTIAEAEAEGYSHLRAHCPGCGRTTDFPWRLVLGRYGVHRHSFIGNIPLRCERCGRDAPSPDIGVWRRSDATGYAKR